MAFKMRGFSGFKQTDEKKNVKVVPGSTYGDDDAMHFKGIDAEGDTATYQTFGYDAEIDAATDSVGVQGPRVDVQALEDSMLSPAEREAEKTERARMAKAKAEREKSTPTKQKVKEENRTGDVTRKEPMYMYIKPRAQEIRPQPKQQLYKDTEEGIKEAEANKAAEKEHKEKLEYLSDSRNTR